MIRIIKIVREFNWPNPAFQHMIHVVGYNDKKIVCTGNLLYCPIDVPRVFEVDHLIMPAIISMDTDKQVHISRVTQDNMRKNNGVSYMAVDRKHEFVAYKPPGAQYPIFVHLEGIESKQLVSTNFDKKAGY